MFQQKLIQSLEEQVRWQRGQIELLQGKLFKATRLNEQAAEAIKPMKYDPVNKSFVEKTAEELYKDSQALAELLSANENPILSKWYLLLYRNSV